MDHPSIAIPYLSGLCFHFLFATIIPKKPLFCKLFVRRFSRWLDNERIEVFQLYRPLIQEALAEWGENVLYLALDTSTLWNTYCVVHISVIYRGRAVPLVWYVLEHQSSSVTSLLSLSFGGYHRSMSLPSV